MAESEEAVRKRLVEHLEKQAERLRDMSDEEALAVQVTDRELLASCLSAIADDIRSGGQKSMIENLARG